MSLFLGPFGILGAAVAVVLESWVFVKIFVGSFLIKGMIGEEIFEAVFPPSLPMTQDRSFNNGLKGTSSVSSPNAG